MRRMRTRALTIAHPGATVWSVRFSDVSQSSRRETRETEALWIDGAANILPEKANSRVARRYWRPASGGPDPIRCARDDRAVETHRDGVAHDFRAEYVAVVNAHRTQERARGERIEERRHLL